MSVLIWVMAVPSAFLDQEYSQSWLSGVPAAKSATVGSSIKRAIYYDLNIIGNRHSKATLESSPSLSTVHWQANVDRYLP
ncbi:hypothetical protein OH492_09150 [Vibrio chagasii]|nr:hypothetical protein [Vibrio chagasii]